MIYKLFNTAEGDPWAVILAQAAKYSMVGIVNSAVGLAVIFAALSYGASDIIANMIGYSVGLLTSYTLNSTWTFSYKGPISVGISKFIRVFAVAYCCNLVVLLLAHRVLDINVYVAEFLGIVGYAVVGFFGSRMIAFADSS